MTPMSKDLRRALASAAELLTERQRIEEALHNAEQQLPALIEARLQASSELAEREANSALHGNEHSDRDLKSARSKLASAREQLDAGVARVAGLKKKRDSQLAALSQIRAEIESHVPSFFEQASAAFREEWSSACALFGVTLARRFRIEAASVEHSICCRQRHRASQSMWASWPNPAKCFTA
jgi:hypothetical protein